jgi:hypothetical protein
MTYTGNRQEKEQEHKENYYKPDENVTFLTHTHGWRANQHFLDVIAARGDNIVLATPRSHIPEDTELFRELRYLIDRWGYLWIDETHLAR